MVRILSIRAKITIKSDVRRNLAIGAAVVVGQGSSKTGSPQRASSRVRWLGFVCLLLTLTGCTTTRSRPLGRSDSDRLCLEGPVTKGIPITIRVPTHVDVFVYDKVYFQRLDDQLRQVPLQRPVRWVEVHGIETDKVVTVDWKRPLSGSLDYSAKLGADQYFDALGSKISDSTIEDVRAAVQSLAAVPTFAAAKGTAALLEEDRLVAYRRFDLETCELESQIVDFVAPHLGDHATGVWLPAPPERESEAGEGSRFAPPPHSESPDNQSPPAPDQA